MGSCVQPKKANSPAMKLTIALAHPWPELKAPIPAAAPDLAVADVVAVAVPGEVVPLMTLSLEVAKILRDLISTRGIKKIKNQYSIEENEGDVVKRYVQYASL